MDPLNAPKSPATCVLICHQASVRGSSSLGRAAREGYLECGCLHSHLRYLPSGKLNRTWRQQSQFVTCADLSFDLTSWRLSLVLHLLWS